MFPAPPQKYAYENHESRGVSLNDRLMKGPDLYNSLVGILSIFRERPIAMCGDLREMLQEIRIREEDRGSQRFLNRNQQTGVTNPSDGSADFWRGVITLHRSRNQEPQRRRIQEGVPRSLSSDNQAYRIYMDDYLDSCNTVEEAISRAHQVAYVHRKGGFEIRNWMSNSSEVLDSLQPSAAAQRGAELAFGDEELARVLGLIWSPDSDIFTFTTNVPRVDSWLISGGKQPTKREVLKLIMSVFDPLGLLAVMTIRGKILMQDIWRSGLEWDAKLPENLTKKWTTWLEDLREASKIRIPRCYALGIGELRDVQLHVFCDASEQAFAAVGYFRLEGEAGMRTALVAAKSRVAPLATAPSAD